MVKETRGYCGERNQGILWWKKPGYVVVKETYMYCTMYMCTCTMYIVHCTLYHVQCTMYNALVSRTTAQHSFINMSRNISISSQIFSCCYIKFFFFWNMKPVISLFMQHCYTVIILLRIALRIYYYNIFNLYCKCRYIPVRLIQKLVVGNKHTIWKNNYSFTVI